MATHLPGLRRFISSSSPLYKARKLSPSSGSKSKPTSAPTASAVATTSEPAAVKLRMQRLPRWDDGWGTQGPRKNPAAIAARRKAEEDAERKRLRREQKDAEIQKLKSLGLSKVTYASAFNDGKLRKGMVERVEHSRMTALQVTALEQLREGGNVYVSFYVFSPLNRRSFFLASNSHNITLTSGSYSLQILG